MNDDSVASERAIDRRALVARHNIRLTAPRRDRVLSVGNGDFAVTVDASGMQTFLDYHDQGASLARARETGAEAFTAITSSEPTIDTATLSTWGWHEMPNPEGFVLTDAMSEYQTDRGPVRYPDRYDMTAAMAADADLPRSLRAGTWLHENPHRLDLGRIGLELRESPDSEPAINPSMLIGLDQRQDLWSGTITSAYTFAGQPVHVATVGSVDDSAVGYRITTSLLSTKQARIVLRFPYGTTSFFASGDWHRPDSHRTNLILEGESRALVERVVDTTSYVVEVDAPGARISVGTEAHSVVIETDEPVLSLVVRFSPDRRKSRLVSFDEMLVEAEDAGTRFWESGAALDFSGTFDARAKELERRIVLSQHLTRIHSSGSLPPQETGLATNSWQGKSHLEMHYWHAAHFAMWGRPELLTRSLDWYKSILDSARGTAASQGYAGVRWPKQVGPDGRESPTPIGSLLAWQQPHPLHLLELVWAASSQDEQAGLLEQFGSLVDETAQFMADFPRETGGVFHLGPPIMPAQEFYDAETTTDPTFELAYWWWGLEIAQLWRERAGVPRHPQWTEVQAGLAQPRVIGGRYAAVASSAELRRDDHPSLLAALGVVPPTPLVDPGIMEATLIDVLADWEWPTAWGWDFPVMAMTATRLGRRDLAIDILLRAEGRNHITDVGHNPQLGAFLPCYLPGNGGLLAAVALMAAPAADGLPAGLPDYWDVRAEGFPTLTPGKKGDGPET